MSGDNFNMSENINDIENQTEKSQSDTAGFINLLLLSLSADAYFKWLPSEQCLIRQDMGAYTVIHPFVFADIDKDSLSSAFDSFIQGHRFDENSRRLFRYFIFIADDYSLYEEQYSSLLKDFDRKCEENCIIAEIDVIDLKSGTVKRLDGGSLSDRKIRKVINETVAKYKTSVDSGESSDEAVQKKKKEIKSGYEELGMVHSKRIINPMTFLIVVNIVIFIAGVIMESKVGEDLFKSFGIQDNELIMQGEWWRLFTSMFLHADFAHISGNMLFLFYLGSVMVRYYKNVEFFAVYFISGLCGNLLSLFLTDYRSLGASGAIMGLGGLMIYRMFFGKGSKLFRKSGNYIVFAVMIAFNLFYGVIVSEANIDNYGHFGGFIGGFLVALAITYIRRFKLKKKNN